MDRAQDKAPNTDSRLIAMAVSLLGSAHEVRALMQSTEEDFQDYCAGVKEPSWPELDRLVALIVREQDKIAAENREFLRTIQEKQRTRKS